MTAYNQRAFINNTVVMRWIDFKFIITTKNIFIQYADGVEKYQIFAFDGSVAYFTELYKLPYSSQVSYDPDYSQTQNDIDRVDFENNYQPTANQVISSDNRSYSGNIISNGDIVSLSSRGAGNIGVQVSGTWTGTLQFEVSVDGYNYASTFAFPIDNSNAGINSTAANGVWRILGGGIGSVRVRASAFTSGIATVFFQTTAAASTVRVAQGAPTGTPANGWMVRLSDGNNIIATSARPVPTSIRQNITTSNVNSSTSNLAASSTFTGTSDSTLGVNAIQVNIKSDQPITIQVQQSDDGTNWDITDTYSIAANIGDGRTFQATASFVRVLSTNTGISATTFFRLQTVLAPVVECLPRALTQEGNLKVSLQGTDGYTLGTSAHPLISGHVKSSNSSLTSVTASILNVILLSSNANRLGATIWNDTDTAILYLKLGTTASTSSYTVKLFPSGYYEIPYGYTGTISGIWDDIIGNARVDELT